MAHTALGRTEIRLPILAQIPDWVGSGDLNAGRIGQKIQRPKITSNAGSSVTITRNVTPTPIAVTGPRPAVELISANNRQSMPTATVAALARIAGAARCSAKAIASWRSS
jgi:hypothetical protein